MEMRIQKKDRAFDPDFLKKLGGGLTMVDGDTVRGKWQDGKSSVTEFELPYGNYAVDATHPRCKVQSDPFQVSGVDPVRSDLNWQCGE